jgi:hypothetical protein
LLCLPNPGTTNLQPDERRSDSARSERFHEANSLAVDVVVGRNAANGHDLGRRCGESEMVREVLSVVAGVA